MNLGCLNIYFIIIVDIDNNAININLDHSGSPVVPGLVEN